jgi:hypothetical protein
MHLAQENVEWVDQSVNPFFYAVEGVPLLRGSSAE